MSDDEPEGPRPTPKMIRLYQQLSGLMGGEPEDLWTYDPAVEPQPNDLLLKFVMVWPADKKCDVTGFSTLGMSERRMPGAGCLAELHLGYRGELARPERERLARFLANVAEYPFQNGLRLGWWDVITRPGTIPLFPGCNHLLLHPRLTPDGIDLLEDVGGAVELLYVVPITALERHLLVEHGRDAFRAHVEHHQIDLLANRWDGR